MSDFDATETVMAPRGRSCLVEGCTCKDARIVSTRRAAYFASVALARGETADRWIEPTDGWRLPTSPALDAVRSLTALAT